LFCIKISGSVDPVCIYSVLPSLKVTFNYEVFPYKGISNPCSFVIIYSFSPLEAIFALVGVYLVLSIFPEVTGLVFTYLVPTYSNSIPPRKSNCPNLLIPLIPPFVSSPQVESLSPSGITAAAA